MQAQEMIATHPDVRGSTNDALIRCIEECYSCAQVCTCVLRPVGVACGPVRRRPAPFTEFAVSPVVLLPAGDTAITKSQLASGGGDFAIDVTIRIWQVQWRYAACRCLRR